MSARNLTRVIPTDAAIVRQSGGGRLVVVRGPDHGESVAVGPEPRVIGSGPGSDARLSDPTISRRHPFVVFDCGAVPRELIESALFGHVRGALTGAVSDRLGAFAEAEGGTLFLDEIGELALEMQPVLLRALDRRMIRPVGGSSYQNVSLR